MGTTRIAIIEDEQEIRECLAILVQSSPGLSLAGTFGTMTAALARLPLDPPDIALVDIGLPDMSGIEGVRRLKQQLPAVRTLILTVYEDNDRIFDALCAGASGYLLKRTPPERLLDAVGDVMSGGAAMSPEVARKVVGLFTQFRPPDHAPAELTPHELRLLKMLMDGHSYRSAGATLGVTPHAISFHLRNIYEKLQVHSKTEAVAKALQRRLIQ